MQGHRDQRIGLGEEFAPGLADPAAHHWCKVKPIAIFKRVHQGPRNLVESHRGASAVIGWRIGNRLHRQDAGSRVIDERRAEPLAIRSRPAHGRPGRAAAARDRARGATPNEQPRRRAGMEQAEYCYETAWRATLAVSTANVIATARRHMLPNMRQWLNDREPD